MKKLLLFILAFELQMMNSSFSYAVPVINGSDTVCAGFRYGYKVIMAGAVTVTWVLPGGWYFLYGQGTDSVFVNCNTSATQIRVSGFNSSGAPVDTAYK